MRSLPAKPAKFELEDGTFELEDGTVVEVKSFGEFRCLLCGEWYPMEERHACRP